MKRQPSHIISAETTWKVSAVKQVRTDLAMESLDGRDEKSLPGVQLCAALGMTDADARRANVLGAYEAVHPERIAGKRFLLVDDICTTGSTLGEAARVLRQAGAADVLGLTLAVTREE